MSHHPAADLARAELYELLIAGGHGHLQGSAADNQGNPQAGIAPTHFLADQGLKTNGGLGFELREESWLDTELGRLLKHRPEW
ncbi:hypothetical protein D3C80_1759290 [compost metagenome]